MSDAGQISAPPLTGGNRIAVVAIHGVGDHPPFEMARSVAALLQDVRVPGGTTRYSAFEESLIRIDVEPVKPPCRFFSSPDQPATDRPQSMKDEKVWGPLDELYKDRFKVQESGPASIDHLFMEGQLAGYKRKGPEDNYQFLRLSGKRRDGPEVHIYDMYWADLTNLGNAFTQIFGELYQVLFHLASVGANTAKAAAISFGYTPPWTRFAACETLAAAILAWLIPFLNLIMFMFLVPALVSATLLPATASSAAATAMISAIAAIVGIAISIGAVLHRLQYDKLWLFRLPVPLGAISCLITWWWISSAAGSKWLADSPMFVNVLRGLVAFIALAGTFAAIWQVILFYEKRRPGSKDAFVLIFTVFGGAAIGALSCFGTAGSGGFPVLLCLRCFEAAFWMLMVSWVVFSLVSATAYVLGRIAVRSESPKGSDGYKHALGAHRTAWLVLGLSGTVFFLVSFAAWCILVEFSKPIFLKALGHLCYLPLFPREWTDIPRLIDDALKVAGLAFLPLFLILTSLGLLVAVWSFAPAVWGEIFPPDGKSHDPEKLQEMTNALGKWLTNGFSFLLVAGAILWAALVVSYPVSITYYFRFHPEVHGIALAAIGSLVGGAGTGLLVLRGKLNSVAGGFRTGVRVALDVDAWLREHPRDSNPTGQICARYVSLLRHIANAGNVDEKYDAVVIFAHSQGTVITADLLRFLAVEDGETPTGYDPSLAKFTTGAIPIFLFTMGCPLRQLYSKRFPSLYKYGESHNTLPQRSSLGVIQWINAFRSGDYVGRGLWSDDYPLNAAPSADFKKDICIGPGAHTHYWDHTAMTIGETLDKLIKGVGEKRREPVGL